MKKKMTLIKEKKMRTGGMEVKMVVVNILSEYKLE